MRVKKKNRLQHYAEWKQFLAYNGSKHLVIPFPAEAKQKFCLPSDNIKNKNKNKKKE